MIGPHAGTRVWLAAGVTDMRCGIDSLAAKVQMALTPEQFDWLVAGLPWQRLGAVSPRSITAI